MPRKNGAAKKPTVTKKKAGKVIPEQLPSTSAAPQHGAAELMAAQGQPVFDRLADEDRYERISRRAYERYEQRGGEHGNDLEDWLTAERLEAEERAAPPELKSV